MTTSDSTSKIVLCTGANRGLGFAILQVAGLREPSTVFILSCRDPASGHAAKEQLAKEGVKAHVEVIELDTTNDEQIMAAVKFIETKYGKLDVLINNAGIMTIIPDFSLPTLRKTCNSMLDVNLTSLAVISTAFSSLLHKAAKPKVINITSGLGSMTNTLTKKMPRYAPYGISKVGTNGLTAHMQAAENDRIATEEAEGKAKGDGRIRFYSAAPGLLKTAFTHYSAQGKDPKAGAEVIVRLMADEGAYEGGSQYEFEGGEMRLVPW